MRIWILDCMACFWDCYKTILTRGDEVNILSPRENLIKKTHPPFSRRPKSAIIRASGNRSAVFCKRQGTLISLYYPPHFRMLTLMKNNVRSLFCLCVVRADAFGISEFRYSGTGTGISFSQSASDPWSHEKHGIWFFECRVLLCYFRFNSPKWYILHDDLEEI